MPTYVWHPQCVLFLCTKMLPICIIMCMNLCSMIRENITLSVMESSQLGGMHMGHIKPEEVSASMYSAARDRLGGSICHGDRVELVRM